MYPHDAVMQAAPNELLSLPKLFEDREIAISNGMIVGSRRYEVGFSCPHFVFCHPPADLHHDLRLLIASWKLQGLLVQVKRQQAM